MPMCLVGLPISTNGYLLDVILVENKILLLLKKKIFCA